MKKRFVAFFMACCLMLPIFLSGCSLFDFLNEDENDSSSQDQTVPTLAIATDERLKLDESTGWYNITLDAGGSYKINASLGDYQGTKYYISYYFSTGSDKATVDLDGTITANMVDSMSWAYLKVELKQQGKSKYLERYTVRITINPVAVVENIEISFNKGDMNYDKTFDWSPWFFNIASDETFQIKPVVKGITNYTVEYELQDGSEEAIFVTADGLVSVVAGTDKKTGYIYLTLYDANHNYKKMLTLRACINGTQQGDNLDYLDARLSLAKQEGTVAIKTGYGIYDYTITVPYAGLYYELPQVSITGYVGQYSLMYQPTQEHQGKIGFKKNDDKIFVMATTAYTVFEIVATNSANEVIDTLYVLVSNFTKVGKGEFSVYDYNQNVDYENNATIELLTNQKIMLIPIFNHLVDATANKTSKASYSIQNENVIKFDGKTILYMVFDAKKVGQTTITFTYSQADSEGTNFDYEFVLNIVVNARELLEIYVANPDAMRISGTSVAINGKIFAVYTDNYLVVINSKSGLSYVINDTSVDTIKRIVFTYVDEDNNTKSCYYDVDTTKAFAYQKTLMTDDYYDYWKDSYRATPNFGEIKVLAIPVWFTNSSEFFNMTLTDQYGKTQKEQIIEDTSLMLGDTQSNLSWKSLKQYYEEESFGQLQFSVTVTEWCPLTTSSTEYKYHGQSNVVASTREITKFALDWYFETNTDKSISDFDGNDDGIIDAVMIYYGASYVGNPQTDYEMRQGGRAYVGGAYNQSYALSQLSYPFCKYSFISCFEMYSNNHTDSTIKEDLKNSSDLSANGILTSTTIHEFGHMFGLYDLYDTVNDSTIFPAGRRTMQDISMAGHDPYSVMSLGWANPYVFDSSDTTLDDEIEISINDFQSSGDLILLTPNWNDTNSVFDEYILIELFTPTGLNEYDLSNYNAGIRIWHINATLDEYGSHMYNNSSAQGTDDNLVKNLVHYIRNDENSAYGKQADIIKNETMFHQGDTFSVEKYNTQFYQDGTMDNGQKLGWQVVISKIEVDVYGNAQATIKLNKMA